MGGLEGLRLVVAVTPLGSGRDFAPKSFPKWPAAGFMDTQFGCVDESSNSPEPGLSVGGQLMSVYDGGKITICSLECAVE